MSRYFAASPIMQELNRIKDIEFREGIKVPRPKIFYVQRYGRMARDQVQEILPAVGRKEWFLFKAEESFPEAGIRRNFVTELAKHATIGKEFDGCVLVELSKDTLLREEFTEFMEFLKDREDKLYYVFATRKPKDAVSVQKCIEQYFFVRTVYAEGYSAEEQMAMIKDICEEFGSSIDPKAQNLLTNGLKSKEWREDERVACRLRNEIYTVIYEMLLEGKSKDRKFSPEMAWKLLDNLQKGNAEETIFGFHKREFEVV